MYPLGNIAEHHRTGNSPTVHQKRVNTQLCILATQHYRSLGHLSYSVKVQDRKPCACGEGKNMCTHMYVQKTPGGMHDKPPAVAFSLVRPWWIVTHSTSHSVHLTRHHRHSSSASVRWKAISKYTMATSDVTRGKVMNYVCHFCNLGNLKSLQSRRFKYIWERLHRLAVILFLSGKMCQ